MHNKAKTWKGGNQSQRWPPEETLERQNLGRDFNELTS